jgi:hypothetical protein
VKVASGRTGPVWNPATGQQIAEINFATVEDTDRAVAVAKAAFAGCRATSLSRRAEILFKLRNLIDLNRERLAEIVSTENGKTMADARVEVAHGLENVEFACGIGTLLKGSYSEQASTGVDVYQLRQPLGVIAGITPLNFPVMVPLWMLASAIACGNTFVLQPSEKVPSASLLLAELAHQAGLPSGVLNVVQGDKVAVERLLSHPDVRAISFVGSTPVAKIIYEIGTRNGKRVQALGGAKNHILVLPDADIEAAADADMELREQMQRVALESSCYGSRRITAELRRRGWRGNRKKVQRLMREDNLLCLRKRSFVVTKDSAHGLPVYPNLAREMVLTGIDQLWIADITYIRLEVEFVYLAVVLDAYSRRVIGWALGRTLEATLTLEVLDMALGKRRPAPIDQDPSNPRFLAR